MIEGNIIVSMHNTTQMCACSHKKPCKTVDVAGHGLRILNLFVCEECASLPDRLSVHVDRGSCYFRGPNRIEAAQLASAA
jgi:hypothetical protein